MVSSRMTSSVVPGTCLFPEVTKEVLFVELILHESRTYVVPSEPLCFDLSTQFKTFYLNYDRTLCVRINDDTAPGTVTTARTACAEDANPVSNIRRIG